MIKTCPSSFLLPSIIEIAAFESMELRRTRKKSSFNCLYCSVPITVLPHHHHYRCHHHHSQWHVSCALHLAEVPTLLRFATTQFTFHGHSHFLIHFHAEYNYKYTFLLFPSKFKLHSSAQRRTIPTLLRPCCRVEWRCGEHFEAVSSRLKAVLNSR